MKRNREFFHDALTHQLSGLEMTPQQRAAVLEKIHGGYKMKKRIPLALVLAIVLLLCSFTAVALSNWNQIKEYLNVAHELSDSTYEWTIKEKLQLIAAMHDAGLLADEAFSQTADPGIDDAEREKRCDQILNERYGDDWQNLGYWGILEKEWPDEAKYQSVDSIRAFDEWNDAYERAHSGHVYSSPMEPHEARERLSWLLSLTGWVREDNLPDENWNISYDPNRHEWALRYTVNEARPGQYEPGYFEKKYDGAKASTMLKHMQDLYGEKTEFILHVFCDDYGEHAVIRMTDMETLMVENMVSKLTEVSIFDEASIDRSKIQVTHHSAYGLWEASYTITQENPGKVQLMPDELIPGLDDTVMAYLNEWNGEHDSYTFRTFHDEENRYVNVESLEEYLEKQASVNYRPAVNTGAAQQIAENALMETFGVTKAELSALKANVDQARKGPEELEYEVRFFGYQYDDQLERLWEYFVRVDGNGQVLETLKREGDPAAAEGADGKEKLVSALKITNHDYAMTRMQETESLYISKDNSWYHFLENCPACESLQCVSVQEKALLKLSPCPYCVKENWLWSPQDRVNYVKGGWGMPGSGNLTFDQALEKANEAMEQKGNNMEKLYPSMIYYPGDDLFVVYYCRLITPAPVGKAAVEPVFSVVLDGQSGQVKRISKTGDNG